MGAGRNYLGGKLKGAEFLGDIAPVLRTHLMQIAPVSRSLLIMKRLTRLFPGSCLTWFPQGRTMMKQKDSLYVREKLQKL